MRILALDIELSPNLAHVWSLWNVNVGLPQLIESAEMICFAAKWLGEEEVEFWSLNDGKTEMVSRAHELLDQADVVLHYNGRKFDIPHLNREFLLAGLAPPSPYQQIDLYAAVRKRFRFPSNKLQYVATALGLEGKQETGGHELWIKCMAGDADAWAVMAAYNIQDVLLLEQLHGRLLPWLPSYPNRTLIDGTEGCPACGARKKMVARGYAYTGVSKFRRYVCTACGKWTRDARRVDTTDQREVAL